MRIIHRTARPVLGATLCSCVTEGFLKNRLFFSLSAYLILMSRTWGLFLVPHGGGLFVLRSIFFLSIAGECCFWFRCYLSSAAAGTAALNGSQLMFRRRGPGVHVGKCVSPFAGHDQDRVLVKFRSNQRVHLGHVTAQPEKPTGDRGQYQDALNDPSVGTLRGDNRQGDANHAEDGREDDDR